MLPLTGIAKATIFNTIQYILLFNASSLNAFLAGPHNTIKNNRKGIKKVIDSLAVRIVLPVLFQSAIISLFLLINIY